MPNFYSCVYEYNFIYINVKIVRKCLLLKIDKIFSRWNDPLDDRSFLCFSKHSHLQHARKIEFSTKFSYYFTKKREMMGCYVDFFFQCQRNIGNFWPKITPQHDMQQYSYFALHLHATIFLETFSPSNERNNQK